VAERIRKERKKDYKNGMGEGKKQENT